jgi:hypothetical protein
MNTKRLQLMVTMLNEVVAGTWKPVKVSFPEYAEITEKEQFDLGTWYNKSSKADCGFSACAMGHAGLDSRFRKMGLKVVQDKYGFDINYKGVESFDGVCDFFELGATKELERDDNDEIAYILFSPSAYPMYLKNDKLIVQVIRRIEKLIELGQDKFFKRFDKGDCSSPSENAYAYLVSKAGRFYKSTQE